MESLIDILNNVSAGTVLRWILTIGSVFGCVGVGSIKIYTMFEKWRKAKNEVEEKNQMIEQHEEKIIILTSDVKDIKRLLEEYIQTQNKRTVASFRAILWRIYRDAIARKGITQEGLKTFTECGHIYEDCKGDDIYHSKLLPEIMKLPIIDEEFQEGY